MDCFQMSFEYICGVYNVNYIPIYLNSYNFDYGLKYYYIYNFETILKYIGLRVRDVYSISNSYSIRDLLLKHECILLSIDQFYCPWHRAYKVSHFCHNCVITDCDDANVTCYDPYITKNKVLLPFDYLYNGVDKIMLFEKESKAKQLKISDVISYLQNRITEFRVDEIVNNIIIDFVQIQRESVTQKDIYLYPMLIWLKRIADGRYQLFYLLMHIGIDEETNKFLLKKLWDCVEIWSKIYNMIIKSLLMHNNTNSDILSKIINRLTDIIKKEDEILEMVRGFAIYY